MCERLLRYGFLFLYVCYGFSLIILSLMLCAEDKNVRKDRHLNYPIYDHTKTAAQVSFQFTLSFLLLFSFLFFFDGLVLVRLCFWFTYIIYLWRSADCSVYFNPNCVWLNSSCCLHFNKISVQIWLASISSLLLRFEQKGHGIPESLINDVKNITQKFFDLPYEEKIKIKLTPATGYRFVYWNSIQHYFF